MEDTTTRMFTPARLIALALIAVLIGSLTYVRFGTGSDRLSVPRGAHAGDLSLERCKYGTEKGTYDADCGTLVVPENREDPKSRLIALPVTRIRARSDHPAEPIFRLEGGPGRTNMTFPAASRFAAAHDVILVGYRGVDGSTVLDCPEVSSSLKHSADFLSEKSFRDYSNAFSSCATRLQRSGVDLAGYSLTQRVDDLESARIALGYDSVDLLSESAGTRTALIYSWRHPTSIHRSVMIGANPPGNFVWDARITDEQIARYSDACANDESCSARTNDLAASMTKTAADIPDHWGFLPIKQGNVRVASFYGLSDAGSAAAPTSAPMTLGSWLSAAEGDPSGFWFMSLAADLVFPDVFVWGDLGAVSKADAQAAKEYFASQPGAAVLGDPGTTFLWGGGHLVDGWPANSADDQYSRMQKSTTPTLVVSGTLDTATPPQVTTDQLLPYLPNGHQVVLDQFGHTTDFWTQQRDAGSHLINTYFDTGKVDDSQYKPAKVDFTPDTTQTGLAKIVAGSMLGLGLITLLSMLAMPLWVHRRGRFGPKSSAVLRSLFPIVLGLGGWLLGVLIVITTTTGVPIDGALLAVLSIGVPVGLGIYWAWVRRDWSAQTKYVGLAAAAGGSLVGAWLGFHAAAGLLAVVTAIGGALAGANLTLILFEMSRSGSVRGPRDVGSAFQIEAMDDLPEAGVSVGASTG